jgi:hypothetical protein
LNKYRRVEVQTFSHRVSIVSGEWSPTDLEGSEVDTAIEMRDRGLGNAVMADSPEGQEILIDAVRSLERRLSPEARARIRDGNQAPSCEQLKSQMKGLHQ